MRIGIDARMYSESGVGRYIRNLIFSLASLDSQNDYFIFLLKKDLSQKFPKNFIKVEADIGWYGLKEQFSILKLLKTYKLDLMHFPHFNIPIFYPGKFIVTIHDLIHQHFQMRRATTLNPITYKIKQLGYNQIFKAAINKAEKILVPSGFVKNQLIDEWSVYDNKIVVTHEAVEGQLIAIATGCTQTKMNRVLQEFNIKPPFIFYVGNAHPHKNLEGLIRAFIELKTKKTSLRANAKQSLKQDRHVADAPRDDVGGLQLVLSGQDHYFWERIKKGYQDKNIIYTGYVTDEELVALYKGARVFVMPSFEEGFGIPLLEAMACDTPVVSSNAGALKEVGADAAVYFDPFNISDMVDKISQVLNNSSLRKQLIEKGKKRYKQFSWEKLAKETLEIYKSA